MKSYIREWGTNRLMIVKPEASNMRSNLIMSHGVSDV